MRFAIIPSICYIRIILTDLQCTIMDEPIFSDEQLAKLRKYLEDNAVELALKDKISKIPYYKKKETLRDYQWLIVQVDRFGKIEMYFTGISSLLKIKGIYVESNRVDSFNFKQIHNILEKAYNKNLIKNSEDFLNEL